MHIHKAHLVTLTWIIRFLYITSQLSTSFVFVVQQACTVKSLWTPVPSTVSNFCLQCLCTQQNFSLCRKVLVQLSPGCTTTTVVGTLIDPRATNATTPPLTNNTVPINNPPTPPPTTATVVPILTPPPTASPTIGPPPTAPATAGAPPTVPPTTGPLINIPPINPTNPVIATNSTVIAPPPGK